MEREVAGDAVPVDPLARFRRWAAVAVGVAVLGYVGWAVLRGFTETAEELVAFDWALYVVVLLLTLVNYGLRYAKWAWLLARVGVRLPADANLTVFAAGLAMVISPGKAGELLKPYLVRVLTGTGMERTIPVLVTERVTDGIAVVALAAIGVSTYYAEGTRVIWLTLAAIAVGLVVVSIRPLAEAVIEGFRRLPVVGRFADRLHAMYAALRVCVSPWALIVTMAMSMVAWGAECVGYWLVFRGLGVSASLDVSTFLYAFATVFGAPSPGGMGMADAALGEMALQLVDGITGPQAVAAALLIRVATLWFGVVLGGLAMLRLESVIARFRRLDPEASGV